MGYDYEMWKPSGYIASMIIHSIATDFLLGVIHNVWHGRSMGDA